MLYMAHTNYIQATIELFGVVICFVLAVMFKFVTGTKKKSEWDLIFMLLFSAVSLFVDAGWYIYDGNLSRFGILSNKILNFVIFMCSPMLLFFAGRYIDNLIEECGKKTQLVFKLIRLILILLALLIPISNIFVKWMYGFNEHNVYYRMIGWYFYTGILALTIITLCVLVFFNRKLISIKKKVTLYIFLTSPFIGTAIQSFSLGFSFVQLGTSLGLYMLLVSHLYDWYKEEKDTYGITDEKKTFWLIEGVFFVLILFISAAIISCAISVNMVSKKNSQQNSTAMAHMVSETIEGSLSEPINVSRIMAQTDIIRKVVEMDNAQGTEEEQKMLAFMNRIKNEYNYQMVFVASAKTKAYYTYEGLSRIMDTENDPDDAWYNEFYNRNIKYELNVDTDKDNNKVLAVFVNMGIKNEDGEFIGVCGVGMSMESLMDILASYEDVYKLDISLTDSSGLIQVATDRDGIEKKYITFPYIRYITGESFYYEKNSVEARLIKYMEDLGWYLVVDDYFPNKLNVFNIVMPSIVIYGMCIVLMMFFGWFFGNHENKKNSELRINKTLSETDKLTGLYNRKAFDDYVLKYESEGLPENFDVIMIDVNGLKNVNDTFGHNAGDEIIIGTAECLKKSFGQFGHVFRMGGDEFAVLAVASEVDIKNQIDIFNNSTKKWKGKLVDELSASVGLILSKEFPNKSIAELLSEADKLMYKNKQIYYSQTGKDRRR